MERNLNIFDNHGTININNGDPGQSKSEPVNARFESSRLQKLKAFCFDHNKMSMSDCLRDATDVYQALYPFIEKSRKRGELERLISWLNSIP